MGDSVHADAGRVLLGGFSGTEVDPDFADLSRDGRVGGAILFRRNIVDAAQTYALLASLRSLIPHPILAVDQEGGRVQRLRAPFPELPTMRRFGEARRKSLTHQAGRVVGRALRRLGFTQNYAPVLDVDSNPDNPVIGDRAFARDPNLVARLGAALVDGLQTEGIAACGKHFPGHGDTNVDSHKALPRLDHDRARLDAIELVPFVAAARTDVAAIMTAHVLFPALDPDHPATLSERVLGPLRDAIGFDGVLVSDDLEMNAIADHYGVEDAAVRAIRAGCDQVLICHQPARIAGAHAALVAAVADGTLDRARLAQAADRVRRLQQHFPGDPAPTVEAATAFDDPEHRALLSELASAPLADAGADPTEPVREIELDEGDPNEVLELELDA